jgi:hypothetical protein
VILGIEKPMDLEMYEKTLDETEYLTNLLQNVFWPKLGAAGTPYARSVRPKTAQPAALPEPETLFDSLLARKAFKEHPNKISSILFYLASIIIHGKWG